MSLKETKRLDFMVKASAVNKLMEGMKMGKTIGFRILRKVKMDGVTSELYQGGMQVRSGVKPLFNIWAKEVRQTRDEALKDAHSVAFQNDLYVH
jgi:hypothetical protein